MNVGDLVTEPYWSKAGIGIILIHRPLKAQRGGWGWFVFWITGPKSNQDWTQYMWQTTDELIPLGQKQSDKVTNKT